ncbi:MAG TPA: helix-turn-helix domain-containing protein [Chloroflexia bacterium]|nr:helix-turn-helix domain-containing protein [Chloroflexia bacterium]
MEAYSFGYWLRLKRKALDLTREGLAARVGCSAATIQKLEEEERRPSAQMAARLAEIFGIPAGEYPDFLRFARGEMASAVGEPEEVAPWSASPVTTRSNLPAPVTSLVGRERETEDIHDYLLRADARLVTLVGPPGIGKTRLSVEAARQVLFGFPDGVFFVSLAPLDDPALLAATVAHGLGYVGARDVAAEELIKQAIGDKHMLVVLDNCEHLIEHVAPFVSGLLSACPRLRVLATSRESLRVVGEWLYPVPAFELPDEVSHLDIETAAQFPILTLFAERARAVQPRFRLTAENISMVAGICKQSDGLPLAVELIAARIRLMPPQALLERLSNSLLVSVDGLRAVPARQRSLANAVDWSYRLLSAAEQRLFTLLSVFSGGFTLESAETVFSQACGDKTVPDLLTSLLDKSLLQPLFDTPGEPRYAMLAPVREFARQRLRESAQEAAARDWHLAYFLDLAEQADRELRGPNQPAWLNRLDTMRDNLRAALDWAIETGRTETALQLAGRLWWYWSMRSEFSEARQWLERILVMPEAPLFPDLYAGVLTQLAHHTYLQIGGQAASPAIEQAASTARAQGNPRSLANALMVLGLVLTAEGSFADARSTLEESISHFREVKDRWGHALAMMCLGYMAIREGNHSTAYGLIGQALTTFRELGDPHFQSVCLYELGSLRAKQGDWEGGLAELRESLVLARELESKYECASGLFRLAETEQHLGRPARAVRLYCAARNAYDSIGAWPPEADLSLQEHLAHCRAALGESAFATAMDEGQAITMEQAMEYALERSPAP